jgi:quinol monooxygenase YgiN
MNMIVIAKLKAKAGEEAKMEEALRAMVAKVAREEGTLIYTLHRSQKDPTQFLFYEAYADAEAFKHHSATPYFKELFGTLQPLLDGAPQIEMYTEVVRAKK